MFSLLLIVTIVCAAADWWAASSGRKPAEYVFKPLTMAVLIAAAIAIADPSNNSARWAMVVGLALSLIGDVFLMLDERYFVAGLGSFLLAHIAYVVALTLLGLSFWMAVLGIVVVLSGIAAVGTRIVSGAAADDPAMGIAVGAYLSVISLMVVAAFGTGNLWAIVGALLFFASDGCIGWDRFVTPLPARSLIVMVTYHVGQIGLVLSLGGV